MYTDTKPCQVCGSRVDLQPRGRNGDLHVADPDATPDARICTNPDCVTNQTGSEQTP